MYGRLSKLPLKFGKVTGYFNCSNNQLTSLVGAPKEVGEDFYCGENKLTSLEGAPKEVGGYFNCSRNQLISLVGAPESVGDGFYCSNNPLPELIMYNIKYIRYILKWQDDYGIWKEDGTMDEYRFREMMKDK